MIDNSAFNNTDATLAAINQLKLDADRLGISWTLIPATAAVVSGGGSNYWPASNVYVIQDNDVNPSRAISLIGRVASSARVMIMHVPPQGSYIIGTFGDTTTDVVTPDPTRISDRETARASGDLVLSTSTQTINGTLITMACTTGTLYYDAWGAFDFDETSAGTTVCQGKLLVDGVTQTGDANYGVTATTDRATVYQHWDGSVSGVGNHTFQLGAMRTVAAGAQEARATHTSLKVIVYE